MICILQPAFPSITAWEKDGIRVAFDFSKPSGQPAVTDITATYTTAVERCIRLHAAGAPVAVRCN